MTTASKADSILHAFYRHRRATPATIQEAYVWPEIQRIQDNIECLRSNVRRLTGRGAGYLLYHIPGGIADTYMLNFRGARRLRRRGYISKRQEERYRTWLTFAIQDNMKPSRVNRILSKTGGGLLW